MEKKTKRTVTGQVKTNLKGFQFTSTKIRYLHSLGWPQGDIARYLEKRPQHISNVLGQKVTNPLEVIPKT